MAVGRISGPLLKDNLLRNGVNLAFETNLLYLDVVNGQVGIKTTTPTAGSDLTVNGTTQTTTLTANTTANLASFTITGNTISSTNSTINLTPSGLNPVVYQGKLQVGNLQLNGNTLSALGTNTNLEFYTTGIGKINLNANTQINGNLDVSGNITFNAGTGGNINLGDGNTDNVVFNADVNSNIIPNIDNTYNLGIPGNTWASTYSNTVTASTITASSSITANGVNLLLTPGNTIFVSKNGNDTTGQGTHEHSPYLTLTKALSVATSGTTIYMYPGTYQEVFPMTVPVGVTIRGAGLRAVNIQPTAGTKDKDCFLLNGETTIEDLTISGHLYNSVNNTGYAFRFASNFTVTTRSPYIRNVTILAKGSVTSGSDPYGFVQGDAGRGALLDGSVANASSQKATLLFHSCTFFTPNQTCIYATNGVRIEWLNSFVYFANYGIYLTSGSTGFAGAGNTRLNIAVRNGTWSVGNTLTYYDTDGTTVLASGTIASISGNIVTLTGKRSGFETLTDRPGKTVYAQGDAKLSTAVSKFGTASLALDGTGDYVTVPTQPDFNFGSGDFTIEGWFYKTASATNFFLFDMRTADASVAPVVYTNGTTLYYYAAGAIRITGTSVLPSLNTWYHIALSRQGTNTKLFVNGTQVGTTYTDSNVYVQSPITIGARWNTVAGQLWTGYIDDFRITKGVAKYTANFTAPTSALTGDQDTVLLLHFNGANGSTTFTDDGVTLQDLRTSGGGTATIISNADYLDFGAEVRSIGSANIYGNYGIYGNGDGVVGYFISHNFAYIGSGYSVTNDPTTQIAANQITKIGTAKIFYTSVDNQGNYSVGQYFSVNQKTGDVTFNGTALNITSSSGVTFTDGVNTTTITASDITTGNIKISGNTVQSLTGDVNITSASGAINLQNNTYVTGNLDVTGNFTIGGNITIGDQTTDTINFVAGIGSNLTPSVTATYDLGTTLLRWKNAYVVGADINGLSLANNTITTTSGNNNLTLSANGTGIISVPSNNVTIQNNLTVNGTTTLAGTTINGALTQTGNVTQVGDFTQTGTFTTSGNTTVTGNITSTGYLQLPVITINGNTISTTTTNTDLSLQPNGTGSVVVEGLSVNGTTISSVGTNADITLTPQGTGGVVINNNQSFKIPVGTTLQRPSPSSNGMVRYNTDLTRYEGYSNGYWTNLGGVQSVDGKTRITPELTPGAGDNVIRFYANDTLTAYIDSTKLYANDYRSANIDISGNTISTYTPNTDLNFTTNGTGGVIIGNLKFNGGTITNIANNGITTFTESSSGASFTGEITTGASSVFPGTISGTTLTVTSAPSNSYGGSIVFNGTTQYLSMTPGFGVGGIAYSFECFFYQTGAAIGNQATILGASTAGGWTVSTYTNTKIQIDYGGISSYTINAPFSYNTWNHLVVCRNNSGLTAVFLNGTRQGTTTDTISYGGTTGYIGASIGGTWRFPGSLSDLRMVTNATVYDPTLTTITVPTSLLSPVAGTRILLLAQNSTTYTTDASNVQTIAQAGTSNVTYSNLTPLGPASNGIEIGDLLTGTGIQSGTIIVANVSGTSTSSTSQWLVNINQNVPSTNMVATAVVLNVTSMNYGTLTSGAALSGPGVSPGTSIVGLGTGSGGVGTYYVKPAQTAVSTTMLSALSGSVKFNGTYGIVIPVGTSTNRPVVGFYETGMIRYNTDIGAVEVYNGFSWGSVAGTSSGINATQANDIALGIVLSLG